MKSKHDSAHKMNTTAIALVTAVALFATCSQPDAPANDANGDKDSNVDSSHSSSGDVSQTEGSSKTQSVESEESSEGTTPDPETLEETSSDPSPEDSNEEGNSPSEDSTDTSTTQSETTSDSSEESESESDSSSESNDESDTASESDSESESESDSDTGTDPEFDCDNLPELPMSAKLLFELDAPEDFTIESDGFMYGVPRSSAALGRLSVDGTYELVFPGVTRMGGARGIRRLADDSFVIVDVRDSSVVHVEANGSVSTLAEGFRSPNGLAIDDKGMVYLTTFGDEVVRIDPNTGSKETIASRSNTAFDGITFSPDYSMVYVGELRGKVFQIPIASDGTPGELEEIVEVDLGFPPGDLDGFTTDICGNVYGSTLSGKIWRIAPDSKTVELVTDVTESVSPRGRLGVSSIRFGTGAGGWKTTSLYALESHTGGVYEIEVGVPGFNTF